MPVPAILDTLFHILELPIADTSYSKGTKWYVAATIGNLYLVNDLHGILATLGTPTERYYFDSEAAALEEMLVYYNFHNMTFPYVDEYRALKNMIPRADLPANNTQSQTMEFV